MKSVGEPIGLLLVHSVPSNLTGTMKSTKPKTRRSQAKAKHAKVYSRYPLQ